MSPEPIPGDATPGRALMFLLHHRSGALDRVLGLVRRHGCVVLELTVGPSGRPGLDRASFTLRDGAPDRVLQQAARLVDVAEATDMTDTHPGPGETPLSNDGAARPSASHAALETPLATSVETSLPAHYQADGMSDHAHTGD